MLMKLIVLFNAYDTFPSLKFLHFFQIEVFNAIENLQAYENFSYL